MPRTTITLSEERYRALKLVAARRGQTIAQVVDQALELAGVNTPQSNRDMLVAAGKRAGLSDQEAMEIALRETAAERAEDVARPSSSSAC